MQVQALVKRNSVRWWLPLLFFAGTACLSLYWQLFHATTHIGDTLPTDYYHFHWNYWWIDHALASGQNIYFTNYVLTPATTNLAYHTLTPFWYPVWALLERLSALIVDPVLNPFAPTMIAMNVIFVLASALTGWTFYLLLHRFRVNQVFALAGGVMLQTTPAMLLSAWLTNINYLSLFWIPLLLLLWDQLARSVNQPRRALRWALIFGVALYGMMMTDYQFALFLAFLIVPFGVWTLWRSGLRMIPYGGIALAVFLVLFWVIGALPYILAFDRSSLSPMSIDAAQGIPFPLGYLTRISPYTRAISLGALILPGVLLALVTKMLTRRKQAPASPPPNVAHWLWFWLIFPPLLLSLGATITLGGSSVQTPYVPFHNLFGGMFRVPARFAPIILIPALIFIGQTLSRIRLRYIWAVPLMLLIFADAALFEPMPLRPLPPTYTFYNEFGREPYDYAILDVPVAGGSGEAWVGDFPPMETQLYGIIHGKRMLNGSIARAPLDSFWSWLYDDPLLAWLGQRRQLEPAVIEAELRERIFSYPIGYVIIHQNYMDRHAPTIQEIVGYFNQLDDLLCFHTVEGDAIVYRTAWHPGGCPDRQPTVDSGARTYWIDLGSPGDERYIGWGYHPAETIAGVTWRWTGEYPQTDTYFDLPPRGYSLSITMQAFHEPRLVTLLLNDVPLGDPVTVAPDTLGTYLWDVPAEVVGSGQHLKLTLVYDGVTIPAEIGMGSDQRRLAVAIDRIMFVNRG
ncbi:MAG: hypothetical protein IAE80_07595 [Anaerolinea sp.]|nr:hypothetical protein [Anaerolinea sp.]